MTSSGAGIYYDGVTSAERAVTVELAPAALRIRAADGSVIADWGYGDIEAKSAPDDVLRLGLARSTVLARLEIRDPQLVAAIDVKSVPVDRSGKSERRGRAKVVAWSIAATVSLLAVAIFGVPVIATELAAVVPTGLERRLGLAVDAQVRSMLDTKGAGASFECGGGEPARDARAAFDKLVAQLEQPAALPFPLRVQVVRRSDSNAITLPGGIIYVFQGLIDDAKTPDELAGVLAHEVGHVAHRDGTRSVLQGAGLSFLFGMLLGDFVGGGAVIIAARVLLQSSYTRDVETAADGYSVELMGGIGGDPRALGTILMRIAGSTHPGMKILLDHPETEKRIEAINALAKTGPTHPLLSPEEWSNIKHICRES
jgi:Zn-dependent protease with chaperone function